MFGAPGKVAPEPSMFKLRPGSRVLLGHVGGLEEAELLGTPREVSSSRNGALPNGTAVEILEPPTPDGFALVREMGSRHRQGYVKLDHLHVQVWPSPRRPRLDEAWRTRFVIPSGSGWLPLQPGSSWEVFSQDDLEECEWRQIDGGGCFPARALSSHALLLCDPHQYEPVALLLLHSPSGNRKPELIVVMWDGQGVFHVVGGGSHFPYDTSSLRNFHGCWTWSAHSAERSVGDQWWFEPQGHMCWSHAFVKRETASPFGPRSRGPRELMHLRDGESPAIVAFEASSLQWTAGWGYLQRLCVAWPTAIRDNSYQLTKARSVRAGHTQQDCSWFVLSQEPIDSLDPAEVQVHNGEKLKVLEVTPNGCEWCKVSTEGGCEGWIRSRYVHVQAHDGNGAAPVAQAGAANRLPKRGLEGGSSASSCNKRRETGSSSGECEGSRSLARRVDWAALVDAYGTSSKSELDPLHLTCLIGDALSLGRGSCDYRMAATAVQRLTAAAVSREIWLSDSPVRACDLQNAAAAQLLDDLKGESPCDLAEVFNRLLHCAVVRKWRDAARRGENGLARSTAVRGKLLGAVLASKMAGMLRQNRIMPSDEGLEPVGMVSVGELGGLEGAAKHICDGIEVRMQVTNALQVINAGEELNRLKLGELQERAVALRLSQELIREALNEDNPKAALILLLESQAASSSPGDEGGDLELACPVCFETRPVGFFYGGSFAGVRSTCGCKMDVCLLCLSKHACQKIMERRAPSSVCCPSSLPPQVVDPLLTNLCTLCGRSCAPAVGGCGNLITLGCGHRFCAGCSLSRMLDELRARHEPECPRAAECKYALREVDVRSVLSASCTLEDDMKAHLLKWHDVRTTCAYDQHPLFKPCPQPDCSGHVELPKDEGGQSSVPKEGRCSSCETQFCCECLSPPHPSRSCAVAEAAREAWCAFLRKASPSMCGESGASDVLALVERLDQAKKNKEYLRERCKRCPHCRRLIEKVSGCDSMICGRDFHGMDQMGGCGHQFHWGQALDISDGEPSELKLLDLDTSTLQTDLSSLSAYNPPSPMFCGRCDEPIYGTRFECIRCAHSRAICWSCLSTQLLRQSGAPSTTKPPGGNRGGIFGTSEPFGRSASPEPPEHIGHVFELVQPAKLGQPTVYLGLAHLRKGGELTVEAAPTKDAEVARAQTVPWPSGCASLKQELHTGLQMGRFVQSTSDALLPYLMGSGSTLPCEKEAVVAQVDVYPDGRVVYSETNQHGYAAGWLCLDPIAFPLAKALPLPLAANCHCPPPGLHCLSLVETDEETGCSGHVVVETTAAVARGKSVKSTQRSQVVCSLNLGKSSLQKEIRTSVAWLNQPGSVSFTSEAAACTRLMSLTPITIRKHQTTNLSLALEDGVCCSPGRESDRPFLEFHKKSIHVYGVLMFSGKKWKRLTKPIGDPAVCGPVGEDHGLSSLLAHVHYLLALAKCSFYEETWTAAAIVCITPSCAIYFVGFAKTLVDQPTCATLPTAEPKDGIEVELFLDGLQISLPSVHEPTVLTLGNQVGPASIRRAEVHAGEAAEWVPPPDLHLRKASMTWLCTACECSNGWTRTTCRLCGGGGDAIKASAWKDLCAFPFQSPGAMTTNKVCQMYGVVVKREVRGHAAGVWSPGDVICRLDRYHRPVALHSFAVLAGSTPPARQEDLNASREPPLFGVPPNLEDREDLIQGFGAPARTLALTPTFGAFGAPASGPAPAFGAPAPAFGAPAPAFGAPAPAFGAPRSAFGVPAGSP